MSAKINHYTAESVALAELKKAESAWRKADPEDVQTVKSAYAARRAARLNYKRVKRAIKK